MKVKDAITFLKKHDGNAELVFQLWTASGPVHYAPHSPCGGQIITATAGPVNYAVALFADDCAAHRPNLPNTKSAAAA